MAKKEEFSKPVQVTPTSAAPASASNPALAKDEVAKAAYYRWLKRGGKHGNSMEDWVEAEKELKARKQQGR